MKSTSISESKGTLFQGHQNINNPKHFLGSSVQTPSPLPSCNTCWKLNGIVQVGDQVGINSSWLYLKLGYNSLNLQIPFRGQKRQNLLCHTADLLRDSLISRIEKLRKQKYTSKTGQKILKGILARPNKINK